MQLLTITIHAIWFSELKSTLLSSGTHQRHQDRVRYTDEDFLAHYDPTPWELKVVGTENVGNGRGVSIYPLDKMSFDVCKSIQNRIVRSAKINTIYLDTVGKSNVLVFSDFQKLVAQLNPSSVVILPTSVSLKLEEISQFLALIKSSYANGVVFVKQANADKTNPLDKMEDIIVTSSFGENMQAMSNPPISTDIYAPQPSQSYTAMIIASYLSNGVKSESMKAMLLYSASTRRINGVPGLKWILKSSLNKFVMKAFELLEMSVTTNIDIVEEKMKLEGEIVPWEVESASDYIKFKIKGGDKALGTEFEEYWKSKWFKPIAGTYPIVKTSRYE